MNFMRNVKQFLLQNLKNCLDKDGDDKMVNYDNLVNSLSSNPRDIVTVPVNNRKGKWFYAFVKNETIFVTMSKEQQPKCLIKMPRPLKREECGDLYDLYLRRKRGEHVSGEATAATRNQVYWYGIFSDMGF